MFAQCFLHIGTEKTGTTSIQHFLARNRERLLAQGIMYPSAPGKDNHVGLAAYAMNDEREDSVRIQAGLKPGSDVEKFRNRLIRNMTDEFAGSSAARLLLSNEHLSSRLNSKTEVARIKALCDRFAAETKVVVYLKNQIDFLVTSYATSIKSGAVHKFPFPLRMDHHKRMDYWRLITHWQESFGRDSMIVRRFEPEDFPGGDLFADFAALIPFSLDGFERPSRLNETLNAQAIAFLREFNRHVPVFVNGRVNPLRESIVKAVKNATTEGQLTIVPEIAAAIEKHFEESNRKISKEYFDGRYDPLFSPAKCVGAATTESLLDIGAEQAIEIAAKIWVQQRRQIRHMGRSKGEPGTEKAHKSRDS